MSLAESQINCDSAPKEPESLNWTSLSEPAGVPPLAAVICVVPSGQVIPPVALEASKTKVLTPPSSLSFWFTSHLSVIARVSSSKLIEDTPSPTVLTWRTAGVSVADTTSTAPPDWWRIFTLLLSPHRFKSPFAFTVISPVPESVSITIVPSSSPFLSKSCEGFVSISNSI